MSRYHQANSFHHYPGRQRGAALMVMLVILVMGTAAFLVSSLSRSALQAERDQKTADALAQAKEALIGYATSVALTPAGSKRPGDLPCPDTNNDGLAEVSCGNASGSTGQTQRIGRLPWKTLGLTDLRDGSGEHLWYAVSNNFKNNTRTTCTAPGQAGCLNSDTIGTITVRAPDSSVQYNGDAAAGTGVVAVIIAPGDVLRRTDKASPQDRSASGVNAPENYLDIANGEDNANFTDGSATDGFIQGKIKDSNDNIILDDQLLVITQDNIMQAIQKRVVAEAKQCLNEYASPTNGGTGRYPWAAKLDPTQPTNYDDTSNRLFGRVPDTPFEKTKDDSGDQMNDTWAGNCNINSTSGWWLNWKEVVFYGLADAYKPVDPPTTPAANACAPAGACISVNPPSSTVDKKFVVIVAGKKLAGQVRSSNADKGTLSNYLEAPNSGGAITFSQGAPSATFNDTVVFQ